MSTQISDKIICDKIILATVIVTQDQNRRILADSATNNAIAIKDAKILAIDNEEIILANYDAPEILDLSNSLIMPGLINAHTHAAMTFLRGLADDMPLMEWLNQKIFPVEAKITPQIVYLGSLLGFAEMLRTGTIACIDMYLFEESVIKAAKKAGLYCLAGEVIFKFPSVAFANPDLTLAETQRLAEKYAQDSQIQIAVNPHAIYTTSPEILRSCRDLTLKLNLPLHLHLAETEFETAICLKEYGKRPVKYCDDLGLFEVPTILAHGVDLNEEDLAILAKRQKVTIAHNPSSNMKLASGIAPIKAMLDNKINVTLGTDGAASNNQLNIFWEMREASFLQKVALKDPTAISAQTALDLATVNARPLFQNIGGLSVGATANCIALKLDSLNMQPMYNPISHLVYATTGQEVHLTMINGEILYQDGQFTNFNYNDLLEEIKDLKAFCLKIIQQKA